MADLGKAYVQIVPSAKGISGKIEKEIGGDAVGQKAGGRIGKGLVGKIGGVLAAAGIGTMIVKGISASIKEGAELEQSLGGIETMFKGSADTVIANASNAYRTAGMSANEYMQNVTSFSASLLQSLGGDTAKAADSADMALSDMSDNANKFGTDMGSIQNAYQGFAKQNYTMLDNLKLGYGGTKTEMQRLLTDAEKFSGVHYDINNLNDVYSAIHVIQDEMGVTGTTAKEAASTLSGSFGMMKAAGKDLLGNLALGKDIGPSMKALADSASTFLFDNLFPAIGNIIKQLPSAIGTFITEAGPKFAEGAVQIFKAIGNGLMTAGPIIFEALNEALTNALTALANWNPMEASEGGTAIMEKIKGAIIEYGPQILKAVGTIALKLGAVLAQLIPKLLVKAGSLIGRGLKALFPKLVSAAGQGIANLFGRIKQAITTKIQGIQASIVGKINGIKTKIANTAKGIKDKLLSPFKKAKERIDEIIEGVKGFFPFKIGKIMEGLKLPRIKVSGGKAPWGIAGKGKKPSFSLEWKSWYAKGGVFDGPSVIGVGEAGREAVVPLQSSYMRPFAKAIASEMGGNGGQVVVNLNYDAGDDATDMLRDLYRGIKRYRRAGAF